MFLLVLSASLVYGVLGGWALVTGRGDLRGEGGQMLSVLLSAWLAPTLATWLAAEALHLLGGRLLLDRRLAMPVRRIVLGGAAGALGCVLGVLAMALLDREFEQDWVFMGAAAAISTALMIVPTARLRRGVCLHCGYSTSGATPAAQGVCTECGADLHLT